MFTLANLVRLTGAKRRSVQLWAEAAAIVAEPATERAGTGVHRTFSEDEVIVACVIAAFAQEDAPIGRLISVGRTVRDLLRNPGFRDEVDRAVRNEKKLWIIYDQSNHLTVLREDHPELSDVIMTYLFDGMKDTNVKANIIYLNGCFVRLRIEEAFVGHFARF